MIARGRVQNGVIVLENGVRLAEGTTVTVLSESEVDRPEIAAASGRMSDEEHAALMDALQRIAALPIEGLREPFCGRDHDRVLYGAS